MARNLRDDLHRTLDDAKRSTPAPNWVNSMSMLIANGTITRERCCDGKVTFGNYVKAQLVADEKGAEFGVTQYAYACPFCARFHITTDRGAPNER